MNDDVGSEPSLEAALEHVSTRVEFVAFLNRLRVDLVERPEAWDNQSLPCFLEAMAAWTNDMNGFFMNRGERVPDQPSWHLLATIMAAARVYE